MLMINLSGLVVVRVIAMFGEVALAAYGIGMRLWFAVLTGGIGVGNAAATLVGQNIGAGKMGRAARAAWVTAGLWAAISAAIGLVFFAFAANLISIFNSHPGVVATGTGFLRWLSITLAFTALSAVLGRAMNGAGDTFWPMVISAAAMFALRIPLAYGLARSWDSAAGVWAALAVSNVVQGLLFASAFLWGRWKTVGQRLVRQRRGAAF